VQKFVLEHAEGIFGPKEAKETREGCIIRILTISTLNPYRMAVGHVGDVSVKHSALIFGFIEKGQNVLNLKKQTMKKRGRKI